LLYEIAGDPVPEAVPDRPGGAARRGAVGLLLEPLPVAPKQREMFIGTWEGKSGALRSGAEILLVLLSA
jgi:hypothetical protein